MGRALAIFFRLFSYLYHLVLGVFLLAISSLAMFSGAHNLKLDVVPWTGKSLTQRLFYGSLAGLFSLVLAASGKFRYLFPVWALMVLVMMVRGFFGSGYTFQDYPHFRQALWLCAGGVIALIGSLMPAGRKGRR